MADEDACIKKPENSKTDLNSPKNETKTKKLKKEVNNFYNHNSLFKGNFQPHLLMNRALLLFAVCEALTKLGCVYVCPAGLSQKVFTVSKAELGDENR